MAGGTEEGQVGNGQPPNEQKDEQSRRPPYTMHGVLHFLQHEWSRYEMDKAKWEMERAEMQACSYKAKNYRLIHNGEDPPEFEENDQEQAPDPTVPTEIDAYTTEGGSAIGWKQGRQLLKQYLQGDWPSNERVSKKCPTNEKREDDSDSESEDRVGGKELDSETSVALGEFDFLKEQQQNRDEWAATDQGAIDKLKEKYKYGVSNLKKTLTEARNAVKEILDVAHMFILDETVLPMSAVSGKREYMDINDALGLPPDDSIDIKDNFTVDDDEDALRAAKWNLKVTLRSHLDSIRAMQFHPVEPVLITASEDGTAKLWNLEHSKDKQVAPYFKYYLYLAANTGSTEFEPVYTFRGHLGPVLCMDLSPTGDHLFTGGLDGVICCWNVPSSNGDPHEAYDPKVLSERLRGHVDAVWSIAFHSSDNRLVSASSDGTIKLWEPGNFGEPMLRSIDAPHTGLIPTSVDFVSTEPSQLLAAYTQSFAQIIDIETGNPVLVFDFGDDISLGSRITRILSHPTMPLTLIAGDDRKIRYFDNSTGKLVHSAVAHVEGISSLAIDPNGLYLLSGSHDGSLRLWNMEKRVCLQEISAHRKKYDASVTCVAFHPSRPLIGSAGADSLAKVYSTGLEQ
uniref:WD_REPEATS_REGION domain-containing protein n=1 Tax=Heterorhabditis bacteriophora TaxID=37862 RepID=A0A1I7XP08_HETBA